LHLSQSAPRAEEGADAGALDFGEAACLKRLQPADDLFKLEVETGKRFFDLRERINHRHIAHPERHASAVFGLASANKLFSKPVAGPDQGRQEAVQLVLAGLLGLVDSTLQLSFTAV